MVYRLTMRTFMVFEYVHSSGIKLRPARPLTNSILYIYNPIGNEWMHLCKEDIHGHLELLTCFSNGATMYQVIEGLKKVVEYWGDKAKECGTGRWIPLLVIIFLFVLLQHILP